MSIGHCKGQGVDNGVLKDIAIFNGAQTRTVKNSHVLSLGLGEDKGETLGVTL